MYLAILLLIIGFVLLLKGADWFVQGASFIAKSFGVSEFVIGLTLVAFGTSVPELASSIAAAIKGSGSLIVGNVLGSNIANIALILGVAVLVKNIIPDKLLFYREGYVLLMITSLIGILFFFGGITIWSSILLLALYVAYTFFLFQEMHHHEQPFRKFLQYFLQFGFIRTMFEIARGEKQKREPWLKYIPKTLIGLVAVIIGAKWLVDGSIDIAQLFGMSEGLIGATLVAFGTSLPELLVTITAARQGMPEMALGNVMGSNIGNTLLILGVSGLITPLRWDGLVFTFIAMVVVTLMLLFFVRTWWKLGKKEGIVLLLLYLVFLLLVVLGL